MVSNEEAHPDLGEVEAPPIKKSKSTRKFRVSWQDEFGGWLQPHETDDNGFSCTLCKKSFSGGKCRIKSHAASANHKQLLLASEFRNWVPHTTHEDLVKTAEIKIAAHVVCHNLAFRTVDHSTKLQQQIFPDSKIAQDMCLGPLNALQSLKT